MTGCAWDDVPVADQPTAEQLASLGERVKAARTSTGLSVDAAAEQAPMSPVTWTKVEKGERVTRSTYAGIERSLLWSPGSIDLFLTTGTEPTSGLGALIPNTRPDDVQTEEDLRLIDELPVPATTKLELMRRYLRLARDARNEAAHDRRRSA